jgi:hypothetical protein
VFFCGVGLVFLFLQLVTFSYFLLLLATFGYFLLLVVVVEGFVVWVFSGGKVRVPKQLRERFDVQEGDCVHLAWVEVLKGMSSYPMGKR